MPFQFNIGLAKCKISEDPRGKPYIIFKFNLDQYKELSTRLDQTIALTQQTKELSAALEQTNKLHEALAEAAKLDRVLILSYNKETPDSFNFKGTRRAINAINACLPLIPENATEVRNHLETLKATCEQQIQKKNQNKRVVPRKSKLISKLKPVQMKEELLKSKNEVSLMTKINNKQKKSYFFKKNKRQRSISDIEVFNGFCYRLLLGDCHPKVKNVHGESGERLGLISENLSEFESFHGRFKRFEEEKKTYRPPTEKELINSEFIKVLAASFLRRENDLHGGNCGFARVNGQIRGVKIDDDQANWEITCTDAGLTPNTNYPILPETPARTFPTTRRDIQNFPALTDAKPFNWIANTKHLNAGQRDDDNLVQFNRVAHKKKVIQDKYYIFLKYILIPDEVYEKIAEVTVSSKNKRELLLDTERRYKEAFKNELLRTPEFQEYIARNPKVIKQLVKEFKDYNKDFTKEKDRDLRIDTTQIKNNYNQIRAAISPSYFKKGLLIGALVGLAIIGLGAIIYFSGGTALPFFAAIGTWGTSIGAVTSATGLTATGIGVSALYAGFVGICAALGGLRGKFKRHKPNNVLIAEKTTSPTKRVYPPREKKQKFSPEEKVNSLDASRTPQRGSAFFETQPKQESVEKVFAFLQKNIAFFQAAVFQSAVFNAWAENNNTSIEWIEKSKNDIRPIISEIGINNIAGAKGLLQSNKILCAILEKNIGTAIINQWYDEHPHIQKPAAGLKTMVLP
ncbi:MAG TPA: hypothetical protein VLI69_03820 [Gammaproteobacteria bacterium]|nr:hypothetical protein [Gammaproteobacteria bacterium]